MHKSFVLANTSNIELNVFQFGVEDCAPGHCFGPAVRQHYLFHYVISGTGTLHTDHGAFSVHPGEGFLIYPHDVTTYSADQQHPWHYMWIEVDGLMAANIFQQCRLSRQMPIYRPQRYTPDAAERGYLTEIVAHQQNEAWLKIIGLSYLFFSALIANAHAQPKEKPPEKQRHLAKAIKYIESRYHENISIAQLANYCSINRSYMSRLFKAEFGLGPKEYLLQYRMNIAAGLLRHGSAAIKVVALSVGYANQLHFSKAFKQVHGLTPSAWRHGADSQSLDARIAPRLIAPTL
ncbi:AraC family transcriptional regulator [Serratia odorifera]|jgi:AraC-like DNA-binding protein|uniref:Arabinose operon regulatory protein n=2 Tax=Serratia odorifera TaxID=618 RepID=D4DXC0_SEROD|nr:AraC family transcriptional regulator [Serratia odorifera]EFE97663.1 transcriptional regulator, AraC family [Serratia odorifera DSM 4582]MBJ2065348.1 AraC family transcriptional regulator [Serratia odorifera]PNK92235.1 AraC family transcriptional regulator [Serratia odorifera]RII73420.1 AraC family transcriptional regulator [Serratia odorifera]VDZ52752.1 Arabinose operon regulatory protein [Serratia odorifera]